MKKIVQNVEVKVPQSKMKRNYLKELNRNKYLYLLMLPAIVYYIIFAYTPMYGLTLAFKEYSAKLGILGSEWVGFEKFELLFSNSYFWRTLFNTIKISLLRLLFVTPAPIIIAVLFSELNAKRTKKVLQTVYTLPHFLSWVIVSGIVLNVLDYDGMINNFLESMCFEKQIFLGNKRMFLPIVYISAIWKDAGWSSLIYLAAIAGINPEIYEAAELDGITRIKKIWYITLPSISTTIVMMLTLTTGHILAAGFDQIFNLINPAVQEVGDILDIYIYRITFQNTPDFSFSTAVGLFTSVVNITVLLIVDRISHRISGVGVFSGGSK